MNFILAGVAYFIVSTADYDAAIPSSDFQLKRQVMQFIERVRSIQAGEIRSLEVRHGLPFAMELVSQPRAGSYS